MQNVIRFVGLLISVIVLISCSSSYSPQSELGKKTRFYVMRMSNIVFKSIQPDEVISFSVMYNGRYAKKDVVTLECYAYSKTNGTYRKLKMDSIDTGIKFYFDKNFSTSILKQADRKKIKDYKYNEGSPQNIIFTPETSLKYAGFIRYKISIEKATDSSSSFAESYLDPCPPAPCNISEL